MQQGGVACKARGIISFSFTFVHTYVCALFLYLINVSRQVNAGLPLRQMRYYGSPAKVGGMILKYYLRAVKNTRICRTKRYLWNLPV